MKLPKVLFLLLLVNSTRTQFDVFSLYQSRVFTWLLRDGSCYPRICTYDAHDTRKRWFEIVLSSWTKTLTSWYSCESWYCQVDNDNCNRLQIPSNPDVYTVQSSMFVCLFMHCFWYVRSTMFRQLKVGHISLSKHVASISDIPSIIFIY